MPLQSFLQKLDAFASVTDDETAFLNSLVSVEQTFPARTEIAYEGEVHQKAFFLIEGWCYCYKTLPNGTRQIVNLQIPGDVMGMRGILLRTADHSIRTISGVKMSSLDRAGLRNMFDTHPRLGLSFMWAMAREEAIIVEHLVNIGRRTAMESLAHLMLETLSRLKFVGLDGNNEFGFPLTQVELGDMLGLSVVHINRLLRELRQDGILTVQDYRAVVHAPDRLAQLAGFDPNYLDEKPFLF